MQINVIGLGYVGLPTAVALARAGHSVTGVDTSAVLVEALRSRTAEISDSYVAEHLPSGTSAADFITSSKAVLGVCPLADPNGEVAVFLADLALHPQHVSQVAVAALVEGPQETNTRLHRDHGPPPGDLRCLRPLAEDGESWSQSLDHRSFSRPLRVAPSRGLR